MVLQTIQIDSVNKRQIFPRPNPVSCGSVCDGAAASPGRPGRGRNYLVNHLELRGSPLLIMEIRGTAVASAHLGFVIDAGHITMVVVRSPVSVALLHNERHY